MKQFRTEPDSFVTSTNGINIEYQQYEGPSIAIDLHLHHAIEILYIKEGSFEVIINEKSYLASAGTLVLLREYALHSVNVLSEDGGGYYVLKIYPSILADLAPAENVNIYYSFFLMDSKEDSTVWHQNALTDKILSPLQAIINEMEENDLFSFFSLKVNTGRLLLSIMRDSYAHAPDIFSAQQFNNNTAGIIKKAVEFINVNYRDPITAMDAAKAVGLSYNYFSNVFSRITGKTFKQYLNRVRINNAKHQLLVSDRSISEISELVGYNNPSYFILAFRRQTGITPAVFAKKYKKLQILE